MNIDFGRFPASINREKLQIAFLGKTEKSVSNCFFQVKLRFYCFFLSFMGIRDTVRDITAFKQLLEEFNMNEYLKPMQMELELSDNVCELLEAIGIAITSKYGVDCHNYGLKGSPIDIIMIYNDIQAIRDTEYLIEAGYNPFLVVSKDTIYEWASIIVSFTNDYPNY